MFLITIRRWFFWCLDTVIGKSSLGGSSNSPAIIYKISNGIRSAIGVLLIAFVKVMDTGCRLEPPRTVFVVEQGVPRVHCPVCMAGDPDGKPRVGNEPEGEAYDM